MAGANGLDHGLTTVLSGNRYLNATRRFYPSGQGLMENFGKDDNLLEYNLQKRLGIIVLKPIFIISSA